MQRKKLKVFADYFQFYLWDSEMTDQAPETYTPADTRRRINAGPHVVAILPLRNMTISVEVQVHDAEPAYDADEWDHIVEVSLHVPSGKLQVHECTGGPVADFEVEPGWYRVRAFFGGLDTVDGSEGDDVYRVVLWPSGSSKYRRVRIHKRWTGDYVGKPKPLYRGVAKLVKELRKPQETIWGWHEDRTGDVSVQLIRGQPKKVAGCSCGSGRSLLFRKDEGRWKLAGEGEWRT